MERFVTQALLFKLNLSDACGTAVRAMGRHGGERQTVKWGGMTAQRVGGSLLVAHESLKREEENSLLKKNYSF